MHGVRYPDFIRLAQHFGATPLEIVKLIESSMPWVFVYRSKATQRFFYWDTALRSLASDRPKINGLVNVKLTARGQEILTQ